MIPRLLGMKSECRITRIEQVKRNNCNIKQKKINIIRNQYLKNNHNWEYECRNLKACRITRIEEQQVKRKSCKMI